jgi:hypothetical protein
VNWLNLQTSSIRHPHYIGSEPVARATWLNVMVYCCEQENGGRIVGARAWKDRQWQQTCGVTLQEVNESDPLTSWDGDDLVIWNYPSDKEGEIRAKREGGRQGGLKSGAVRTVSKDSTIIAEAELEAIHEAELERKGREGKGMEDKPPTPNPAPASPPLGGGKKDALPTTPEAIAVASLFSRRLTTPWGPKEVRIFKQIVKRGILTADAMERIHAYYEAERAKGEEGKHRRDLKTFLNNFDGELDRATAFTEQGEFRMEKVPTAFNAPMNPPPRRPDGV